MELPDLAQWETTSTSKRVELVDNSTTIQYKNNNNDDNNNKLKKKKKNCNHGYIKYIHKQRFP